MLRKPLLFLFPCFGKIRSRFTPTRPDYNVYSLSSGQTWRGAHKEHVELDDMSKSQIEKVTTAERENGSEEAIIGLDHGWG